MFSRTALNLILLIVASTPLLVLAQVSPPMTEQRSRNDESGPNSDATKELTVLQQADLAIQATDEFLKLERFDLAEKVLAEAQSELSLPEHIERFREIQQLRNRVRNERQGAELDVADQLLGDSRLAESQSIYKRFDDSKLGEVSPEIRIRANEGLMKSTAAIRLKDATAKLEAATRQLNNGDYKAALDTSKALLALGPDHIDEATKQRAKTLADAARSGLREAELAIAGQLLKAGLHAKALEAYQALVALNTGEISDEQRDRAVKGAQAAAGEPNFVKQRGAKVAETLTSILDQLLNGVITVVWWMLCLGGVVAIAICCRAVIRKLKCQWARSMLSISLEDLTVAEGERALHSQALSRQLLADVNQLKRRADGDILEELNDLDGSTMLSIDIQTDPLGELNLPPGDETPIRLGPFSISPRYLISLLRAAFRPWYERELYGTLWKDGNATVFTLDRDVRNTERCTSERDAKFTDQRAGVPDVQNTDPRIIKLAFEVRSQGEQARRDVLAEAAARIAFELAKSRPTDHWESYRNFRLAMRILDREREGEPGTREQILIEAEARLRNALISDPQNMLARFHLANVLRKRGDNLYAARHFNSLYQDVLDRRQQASNISPSFDLIVQYNVAVSMFKLDWELHRGAFKVFWDLGREFKFSEWERDRPLFESRKPSVGDLLPSPEARAIGPGRIDVESTADDCASGDSSDASAMGAVENVNVGTAVRDGLADSNPPPVELPPNPTDVAGEGKILPGAPLDLSDQRNRIALFVRSAYVSAILSWMEKEKMQPRKDGKRDPTDHERFRQRQEKLMTVIRRDFEWVRACEPRESQNTESWQCFNQALAVVENAVGRACYVMARHDTKSSNNLFDEARIRFHNALVAKPNFTDAHLNRASLLIHRKNPFNWARLAEDSLLRALETSPLHDKAHHLLGNLYLRPEFARYEHAKELLEKAETTITTLFEIARAFRYLKRPKEALDKLRQSRMIDDRLDGRYIFFIETVIAIANSADEADKEQWRQTVLLLNEAIEWGVAMMGKARQSKSRRTQRLEKVGEDLIKTLVRSRRKFTEVDTAAT